jgi:serine/threonine protein kinase
LVHRGLKPETVLMVPMIGGYLTKVADFGFTKEVSDYLTGDQNTDGPQTKTGIGT